MPHQYLQVNDDVIMKAGDYANIIFSCLQSLKTNKNVISFTRE
jgi:hypothetical protein